ncbi:hypothetical protein SYYSPA8_02870 [Streptomyces yaizuensis]|uniref:Uncharacterized protein n=1 Tax=Streptomyces yaizuensis TaxID=2989713 RepID=A0ABQ5NS40_9ACTN|nr:hypothetical protein SYYSPA8_02870 [Streptomyces sp. YSPA8]
MMIIVSRPEPDPWPDPDPALDAVPASAPDSVAARR